MEALDHLLIVDDDADIRELLCIYQGLGDFAADSVLPLRLLGWAAAKNRFAVLFLYCVDVYSVPQSGCCRTNSFF